MAEVMLRDRLARRAPDVSVSSAGLLFDGRPAEEEAIEVMAEWGLDINGHRSRKITSPLLDGGDLLIGMERRHVREAAVMGRNAFSRAFTLPELVARGTEIGPRGASMSDWTSALSEGRTASGYLGRDLSMEVADPMGLSIKKFRETADELHSLLDQLVELAWPAPHPFDGDPAVARTSPGRP